MTRQELVDAANTVEGIKAHPYYVQDTTPGHTYVRLDRIAYPNPFGGVAYWGVIVALPQDMAEAEQFVEARLPDLKAALDPHLVITEAVMQRLQLTGVGDLPCLFINGHRED